MRTRSRATRSRRAGSARRSVTRSVTGSGSRGTRRRASRRRTPIRCRRARDRESVGEGKRGDFGGGPIIKKKKKSWLGLKRGSHEHERGVACYVEHRHCLAAFICPRLIPTWSVVVSLYGRCERLNNTAGAEN